MKTGAWISPEVLGVWIHKAADDQALLRFDDDLAVESYRNAQKQKQKQKLNPKKKT